MVASVQVNLLFQSLNKTREEILAKYPINTFREFENDQEEDFDERQGDKVVDQHQYQQMNLSLSKPYQGDLQLQQQNSYQMPANGTGSDSPNIDFN